MVGIHNNVFGLIEIFIFIRFVGFSPDLYQIDFDFVLTFFYISLGVVYAYRIDLNRKNYFA